MMRETSCGIEGFGGGLKEDIGVRLNGGGLMSTFGISNDGLLSVTVEAECGEGSA